MEYFNYIRSTFNVLCDRGYDYYNNYISSYSIKQENDIDTDTDTKIIRIYPQVPRITQIKAFFSDPTHIIDNIYVGSAYNVSNYDVLHKYNIRYVINMTSDLSNYHGTRLKYDNFPLYDNNKESIKVYLIQAYKNILNYQSSHPGDNILVHCFMGASRSVSVIVYYLMMKHNFGVQEALFYIRNKREIINISQLFYKELCELEQEKNIIQDEPSKEI